MSKGCFITGTDTGVGKTVVTAALASVLRSRGLHVGVMKPVETGCPVEDGRLQPQDSLFLRRISGCAASQELVTPYTLREPLAPAIAAELEGITIDMHHIHQCYKRLCAEHDIVLVEGAGGLLVPLTQQLSMHDMAVTLDLPILIVARNILGTINHTTLTVTVASTRSHVLGVVLNHTQPSDQPAVQTNADALRRWGKAPLLGEISYSHKITLDVLRSLGEQLDVDGLLEAIYAH